MPIITSRGSGFTQGIAYTNPTNAYDAGTATFATWSSTTALESNTSYVTGYDFSTLPVGANLISVTATVKQYVSATNRMTAPTIQPYVSTTPKGSSTSLTNSATSTNSQAVDITSMVTVTDLKDVNFRMQFVAQHYNGTQSGTQNLDYVELAVDYEVVTSKAASESNSIATSAVAEVVVTQINLSGSESNTLAASDASSRAITNAAVASESNSLTVSDSSSVTAVSTLPGIETGSIAISESAFHEIPMVPVPSAVAWAVVDKPDVLVLLDSTHGFTDFSGHSRASSMATGTVSRAASVSSGAKDSLVLTGANTVQVATEVFQQDREGNPFSLEASVYPFGTASEQKILSHASAYDGITVNGTVVSFGTQYLAEGSAKVSYDLKTLRSVHVVGVHTPEKNMLFVDGELVGEVEITSEQKEDSYVVTDGKLYSGASAGAQSVAVNGLATYNYSLSSAQVKKHFNAARRVVDSSVVPPVYGGAKIPVSLEASDTLSRIWTTDDDWASGYSTDVSHKNGQLLPTIISGTSVAGNWMTVFALDSLPSTSIYGASLSWEGDGATVEASLDGTVWETAVRGKNLSLISPGYDPTGQILHIRVSFPGGIADDTSYVDNLTATAQLTSSLAVLGTRPVTVGAPAYRRTSAEPITYRSDAGVELGTAGTITIGADTSPSGFNPMTVEIWMLRTTATAPTVNVAGTTYMNGVPFTTHPVGQWGLYHIVMAAPITGNIVITGPAVVNQVALYPTALSNSDILEIYKSYTGIPVISVGETDSITISEPATPANIYSYDWSITGAG